MVENKFGVPKRHWKKWNEQEQYVFNSVYQQMTELPHLFVHPLAPEVYEGHWDTTAWNAAWIAADDLRWLRKGKV